MIKKTIRKIAAYLAFATVLLYIITGFGITQYRIVGALTFGLLGKALSTKIHSYLIYPLLIFLILHLSSSCDMFKWLRKQKKPKKTGKKG
jgi:hypothetical protein